MEFLWRATGNLTNLKPTFTEYNQDSKIFNPSQAYREQIEYLSVKSLQIA